MPAGKSYNMETLNPLSDEFYRRYGHSTDDMVVFNPTVWNQQDVKRIEPYKVQRIASKPTSGNAVLRKKFPSSVVTDSVGFSLKSPESPPLPEPVTEEEPRDKSEMFMAIFVRLLLIGHNVLTVWRVTETYNNNLYWLLMIAHVLTFAEGLFTVIKRGGIDYKWWCPCFLIYLASTLPAVWLLQLKQYEIATKQSPSGADGAASSIADVSTTTPIIVTDTTYGITDTTSVVTDTRTAFITAATNVDENVTTALVNNVTGIVNATSVRLENATAVVATEAMIDTFTNVSLTGNATVTVSPVVEGVTSTMSSTLSAPLNSTDSTITTTQGSGIGNLNTPNAEIWLIIVEESLIYLLVFARWLLPRRDMSREFLADLLLEFLAIASDIMELLAVFDEDKVRESLMLTYWVMAVWSASFIQFIPVLAQKRMFRQLRAPQRTLFTKCCGTSFVEIAYTCMSIFLQDGPFLVLRLYIMISLNLITYSLVFFVLKNAVTVVLLVYRLGIMCYRLPCCKGEKQKGGQTGDENVIDHDNVDDEEIDKEYFIDDEDVSVNDSTNESREKAV